MLKARCRSLILASRHALQDYAVERLDSYMTLKRSATCFDDLPDLKTHNSKLTHES